jgi:hypothetical protein
MHYAFRALSALLLSVSASALAQSPIRSIDIAQSADGYTANVVMFAPVSTSVAWDVLTDFENMEKWVPNVRESKVTARDADAVTVEQQGVAKFGIASFPYVSVRQMQLKRQETIRSTQIKGSMRRLESLMTLAVDGNGTRLTYHLEMVPAGLAAAVLNKDFLEHELREQFSAIVGEMVRRSR